MRFCCAFSLARLSAPLLDRRYHPRPLITTLRGNTVPLRNTIQGCIGLQQCKYSHNHLWRRTINSCSGRRAVIGVPCLRSLPWQPLLVPGKKSLFIRCQKPPFLRRRLWNWISMIQCLICWSGYKTTPCSSLRLNNVTVGGGSTPCSKCCGSQSHEGYNCRRLLLVVVGNPPSHDHWLGEWINYVFFANAMNYNFIGGAGVA